MIRIAPTFLVLAAASASVLSSEAATSYSPKHVLDVSCQAQAADAVIAQATRDFGRTHRVLTSGYQLTNDVVLERYPPIFESVATIALRSRSTNALRETYYLVQHGSTGLTGNGESETPAFRCDVTVEPISRAEYERRLAD